GGSRKRIVLWRAPRPKRGRVATSDRVAWPTTRRLPALHSERAWLFVQVAFRDRGFGKTRTQTKRAARTEKHVWHVQRETRRLEVQKRNDRGRARCTRWAVPVRMPKINHDSGCGRV